VPRHELLEKRTTLNFSCLAGTSVTQSGGVLVLLVITVLNVYKPRDLTPYGWRKQEEFRTALFGAKALSDSGAIRNSTYQTERAPGPALNSQHITVA